MKRHPVLPLHQVRSFPFAHPNAISDVFLLNSNGFLRSPYLTIAEFSLFCIRKSLDKSYVILRMIIHSSFIKAGNTFSQGVQGGLGAICQVEFVENIADMGGYRALGDI